MINMTGSERPHAKKRDSFEVPEKFGPVKAWSFSGLKKFEQCPYSVFIDKVRRISQKSSSAADRGTQIHQQAEDYVNGTLTELPDTLKHFTDRFNILREGFVEGKVELEGDWGFNPEWAKTGWMDLDTWARIKLDCLYKEDETSARVIDYKTGKKFGNEMSHGQQALLYAIATFFKFPELEFAQTELWYLDQNEVTIKSFTRAQAMMFAPGIHARAIKMTTCEDFEPTPSKEACRWCSYRKPDEKTKEVHCQWGIE
jgi:RecB family exonuclease